MSENAKCGRFRKKLLIFGYASVWSAFYTQFTQATLTRLNYY